jgi:hypothetical protein
VNFGAVSFFTANLANLLSIRSFGYHVLVNIYQSSFSPDAVSMARVCAVHGMVCLGMTPLNLAPSTGELQQGYAAMRDTTKYMWQAYQSKDLVENIANHRTIGLSGTFAISWWLVDIWTEAATDEERLILSPKELFQMAKDYDYGKCSVSVVLRAFENRLSDVQHQFCGNVYSIDAFLEIGSTFDGLGLRHSALPDVKKVAWIHFDAELRNIADGGHLFAEYFMLLGTARWIGEAAGAQKASTLPNSLRPIYRLCFF